MKKATSFRIEEEQLEQLDKLVVYYEKKFMINISKSDILERLIKIDFERLCEEKRIK